MLSQVFGTWTVEEYARDLDDLHILGVKYSQEVLVTGKSMKGLQKCSSKLDIIGKQISNLEVDLPVVFR
jgi:hypothetical protein